ncbi:hypothetical protein AB1J06_15410 [Agrobacterium tumefaciens]|uniref:hypothetical protein n=1 Tax=Agrobacterium tumefaciens TaxID=358 RepID=UPI003458F939
MVVAALNTELEKSYVLGRNRVQGSGRCKNEQYKPLTAAAFLRVRRIQKEACHSQYRDDASCRGLFQGTRGGIFYRLRLIFAIYLKYQSGEHLRLFGRGGPIEPQPRGGFQSIDPELAK